MKKRNLWIYIFGITIIIIGLIKLDTLISMVSLLWNACRVLVFGAMMAFVINLVMAKIEKRLNFMKKGKRATSLLLSLILIFLFVYFLITLVVPSLSEAIGVIVQVLPKYFENAQKFLVDLFENNPQLANSINNRFIVVGIIAMLLYQQLQNTGMIVGLLPITGITLPLISYGGSSILSYFISFAIILNISPATKRTIHLNRSRKKSI